MMTIPNYMLPSMAKTFQFEGGYVASDMHGYPALFGFTASFLMEDAKRRGIHITEAQAGADITAMYQAHLKGQGGLKAAHSKISYDELHAERYEKAYETYFSSHGLEAIASQDIQKYAIEFSYNRGADSLRWGMLYAAGVMPRDQDPLLNHSTPAGLSEAIQYANGFLATGVNRHADADHPRGDAHENMLRFNARLRVAKMMQESQFAATHTNRDSVLGRFNRAFEFPWPAGSSIDNPHLDPVKDEHFLKAYDQFKVIYEAYKTHKITKTQFTDEIAQFSINLLGDPTLPSNGTAIAAQHHIKALPFVSPVAATTTIHVATAPARHPHAVATAAVVYYIRTDHGHTDLPPSLTAQYYSNLFSGTHIALEAPGKGIIADLSINPSNEVVANGLNAAGVKFTPTKDHNLNADAGPNALQVFDGSKDPASISWKTIDGKTHHATLTPTVIAALVAQGQQDNAGSIINIPNLTLNTIGEHLDPRKSDTITFRSTGVEVSGGAVAPANTPLTIAQTQSNKVRGG